MTEWWRPENLEQLEVEFQEHPEKFGHNDFWAYRRMASGASPAEADLHVHNDLRFPRAKIESVRRAARLGHPSSMLDAGCGAGFMTAAMADVFPGSRVVGLDVSRDAIEYASRAHRGPSFATWTLSPESPPPGTFDLIWCIDFYPFTRNDDAEYQARFIRSLVDRLEQQGRLLIVQSRTIERSLASCLDDVIASCPELSFSRVDAPHPRLPRRTPLAIGRAISRIASATLRRELVLPVVVVTRRAG